MSLGPMGPQREKTPKEEELEELHRAFNTALKNKQRESIKVRTCMGILVFKKVRGKDAVIVERG